MEGVLSVLTWISGVPRPEKQKNVFRENRRRLSTNTSKAATTDDFSGMQHVNAKERSGNGIGSDGISGSSSSRMDAANTAAAPVITVASASNVNACDANEVVAATDVRGSGVGDTEPQSSVSAVPGAALTVAVAATAMSMDESPATSSPSTKTSTGPKSRRKRSKTKRRRASKNSAYVNGPKATMSSSPYSGHSQCV